MKKTPKTSGPNYIGQFVVAGHTINAYSNYPLLGDDGAKTHAYYVDYTYTFNSKLSLSELARTSAALAAGIHFNKLTQSPWIWRNDGFEVGRELWTIKTTNAFCGDGGWIIDKGKKLLIVRLCGIRGTIQKVFEGVDALWFQWTQSTVKTALAVTQESLPLSEMVVLEKDLKEAENKIMKEPNG